MDDMINLIGEYVAHWPIKKKPPMQDTFRALVGVSCILEGGLAAGKTTAGQLMQDAMKDPDVDLPVLFCPEDIDEGMTDYFYEELDAVCQGTKAHNEAAYPMQIQVVERRKANYRDLALVTGQSDKPYGGPLRFGIGDRLAGDGVFAVTNYLNGGISKRQLDVYMPIIGQYPMAIDCIFFLDVTAQEAFLRKNRRAKQPGGRKIERTVPMDYLHKLRLGYYMLLQAIARRGEVSIQLLANDRMFTGRELLFKVLDRPTPIRTKELWAHSSVLNSQTSMAELDSAFEKMHQAYFGIPLKASV